MNRIHVGTKKQIEIPKGNCLVIADENICSDRRPQIFDPLRHSFDPLANLDYRSACEFIDILDAVFSRGESTLTKDTGLDFIADALEGGPKSLEDLIPEPDKKSTTGHIWAYGKIRRILRSPVLRRMLCTPTNFSFNPRSVILARVNRAELGEFDALVIGLLLMSQFKGQLVVPDFGFYGRDTHARLIRENRLIAGVNYLDELPEKLRSRVLLIPDRIPRGALYDDAVLLAKHKGLVPDPQREDCEFNRFVRVACA